MSSASGEQKPVEWNDMEKVAAKILVPGVSDKQVTEFYNTWASNGYDENIKTTFIVAPRVMGEAMAELFPTGRERVTVLDVGAGTGFAGKYLKDMGFGTLDALDPAAEMLKMAEEKNIYRNLYNCIMSAEPTDIPTGSYDAVILVGVIGHGCVPCAAFEEMSRLVKPGGYIVNCMRAAYLDEIPDFVQHWKPMVTRLEASGRWKVLKMERYEHHFIGKDGMLMVIQVL